jgi:hypothetical protein
MSQLEYISLLSEMLAEIRDGHLGVEYDKGTDAELAKAQLFPFSIMIEDARLMVVFNDTPNDSTIHPGMEVLSINGHTANDLIQLILPKITGDGFIDTGKKNELEHNFSEYYWVFVDQSAAFTILARDAAGKIVTAKVTGVLNGRREKNRNNNIVNVQMQANVARLLGAKENISLSFVSGSDIASLRIHSFMGRDFLATIGSVFKTLYDKKTRVLILDLRGNSGGEDNNGAFLVSQFTDKPFRYFDRIHLTTVFPSFATFKPPLSKILRNGVVADPNGGYLVTTTLNRGVGEQHPAKYPFLGKLFVLMDGGTFSAAADVTAMLRYLTHTSFVGEESGGAFEGNTSGLNAAIKLPNSKLSVEINMFEYWNAVSGGVKGRGTQPDYLVKQKMTDLLRGVDTQWKRVMELALAGLNN